MKPLTVINVITFWAVLTLGLPIFASAQQEARLSVVVAPSGELVIAIQPEFHTRWGFLYPMTYQVGLPAGSSSLKVEEKYSSGGMWTRVPDKTSADHFDAVEAARFDYPLNQAFVSSAFSPTSDSLFLRITDQNDKMILPVYRGISKYYDNRRAVVTITADDWSDWTAGWYASLLSVFRSYGLYVTAGVISGSTNTSFATWIQIQQQLDSGFVEVAAHSRTHPDTPYADPSGEVVGCFDDIVNNLTLPRLFGTADKKYVYVWLAPYGHYDSTVDSLLALRSYLVPRLYPDNGDSTFGVWDGNRSHYSPIYPTREIGAPSWGGGSTDLAYLNATFDTIAGQGGVYHFMWHPQTVFDDRNKPYFTGHLDYISRRNDIWYANLGHVYLYHLLQQENGAPATGVTATQELTRAFELQQNYPNPFNPLTVISSQLTVDSRMKLAVYDLLGREVAVLANGRYPAGRYSFTFDGSSLSSGVYFYRLEAGSFVETRRMMLLK